MEEIEEMEKIDTATDTFVPREKCCCGAFHLKTGAYTVAMIYAVIIVSNLCIRAYKSEEVEWNWQLLFLVSDSAAVISLFYGVARERPAFLQPFTVVSLLTITFCILLTAFYCFGAVYPMSYYGEQIEILLADKVQVLSETFSITQKEVIFYVGCICTFVYACTVVIHSWFMVIVVQCAQLFRETRTMEETLPVDCPETPSDENVDETARLSSPDEDISVAIDPIRM